MCSVRVDLIVVVSISELKNSVRAADLIQSVYELGKRCDVAGTHSYVYRLHDVLDYSRT